MAAKKVSLVLGFSLVLAFCVNFVGAEGEGICETCSRTYYSIYHTTVYGERSTTRRTCTWVLIIRRCRDVRQYHMTSSVQSRTRTMTSYYQCSCSTLPVAGQPTATGTSSNTASRTTPPVNLSGGGLATGTSSSTATRTVPPDSVSSSSRTVDAIAVNLPTVLPTMPPAPRTLNDSTVQFDTVDPGGLAGIVVFLVVLIVVSVVMVVLVVFGVYKYRTRSNKSSVDIGASVYYSAPNDDDTIRLEGHTQLVSNNPMYESIGAPNRNAYEEVPDFETKAVPNGNADATIYGYVPSNVARVNMQSKVAVGEGMSTEWTEPGSYASLQSSLEQSVAPAYENVQYRPPAESVVELYDDLSRMRCIEIPPHTLRRGPVLGSGEFGVVHKGMWSTPEGTVAVALKVSHRDAPEPEKVKLLQEAAIMKQFVHPNVVRLLGAVTVEEPLVLVMELLSSGDLKNLLIGLQQEASRIDDNTPSLLLKFCCQIAEGMKYLSGKGFIHRDLAARNILLDSNQDCKISDFGLSRGLDEKTYYMASGGKVPFRSTAPEALFYKKYSTHSDVWSYGMLLYEIWSLGEPPYKDLSLQQVIEAMHEERHDIIVQSPPPGCPRAIYSIMVDCWNLEYHSRPDFAAIVDLLTVPGSQAVLDIPQESLSHVANPQLAAQLGAPMASAGDLYMNLQRKHWH